MKTLGVKIEFEQDYSASNTMFKCIKCGYFITEINIIKNILKDIIPNDNNNIARIEHFLDVLLLLKNEEFVKYHTKNKLENLLLYFINLIIDTHNGGNDNIKFIHVLYENNKV